MALVGALALPASAQEVESPFSLYVGGLLSLPQEPQGFKEGYQNGWHGFAGIGLGATPLFEVVGKVEYHTFAFDFGSNDTFEGGDRNIWMFGADGRFGLGAPLTPVKPFLFGGLGLAKITYEGFSGPAGPSLDVLNNSQPEDQDKLYWNLGGGLEFGASPQVTLFVQARYVGIETEGNSSGFIPISLGMKFF